MSPKTILPTSLLKVVGSLSLILAGICNASAAEILYSTPSSTNPSKDQEIASSVGVSAIGITIPGGGEIGIDKINRDIASPITIEKDGEPLEQIYASDIDKVKFSGENPNEIIIVPEYLNQPGKYTVSLPRGLVEMARDLSSIDPSLPDEQEAPIYLNAEYSFDFYIVEFPEFSFTPKGGLVRPTSLYTVTLTLQQGSQISIADGKGSVSLHCYDRYLNSSSLVTTYSAKVEGNNVVLTANNPSAIKGLMVSFYRSWYYFSIPKDLIEVTLGGKTMKNPKLEFSGYDVRESGAEGYAISPSPADNMLPEDVKVFQLSYPKNVSLHSNCRVGSVGGYLKQCGPNEEDNMNYFGYIFGTYIITDIDDTNRIISMKLQAPFSDYAYDNDIDKMETSYYCFSLCPQVLYNVNTLNFTGYYIQGKDACSLNGASVVVNDELRDDLELKLYERFTAIELDYPFAMNVKDDSKEFVLKLNNEEVATVPIRNLKIPADGEKYFTLTFTRANSKAGTYTLEIPGGMLQQMEYGNYGNMAQKVTITIPGETSEVEYLYDAEAENKQEVYYNLNGQRVDSRNLSKGIYIRVKGNEATKVIK